MKTTFDKKFDAVKYMREQREKLSEKLSKRTKEEIVEYFKRKKFDSSCKAKFRDELFTHYYKPVKLFQSFPNVSF